MITQTQPAGDSAGPAATDPAPPAADLLLLLARGYQLSRAIFVAAELGIAELLADGERGSAELAALAGVDEPSLSRPLRALTAYGIFREVRRDRFALTELASHLRAEGPYSVRDLVLMYGDPNVWDTWAALPECVRSGRTGFHHLFGLDNAFEYYPGDPRVAAVFDAGMTARSRLDVDGVVGAFDPSGVRMVVDVGGGHGRLLTAILRAHAAVRGIVYDLPQVVEGTRAAIRDAGLEERCAAVAGDMFSSVPAGADVYLLSRVLHDWSDERAAELLRRCREAMPSEGRLIVYEAVVPEVGEVTPRAQLQFLNDLNMLVRTGGRERTEREFRDLFAAGGLRLTRILPVSFTASALEAVPLS